MTTRQIIILCGAVLLLFGSIGLSRFLASQKEPPRKAPEFNPVRIVETIDVENSDIQTTVQVYGKLTASEKLQIFSEVTGALLQTSQPFKKGTRFSKGSLLLSIDAEEFRLNIQSQKATLMNAIVQMMPDLKLDYPESYPQWQEYLDAFTVDASIKAAPKPVNAREKYFVSSRNIYAQYYSIKSQESRLSKYAIYAPFSGIVTQTSIFPGTVIRAGQPLGELMNPASYELEATVGLEELKYLKAGDRVNLQSEDVEGKWIGTISRIGESIDPGTQSAILYVGVRGNGLKENMYLRGSINSDVINDAVEIPRKLLNDQNQVYVVADTVLAMRSVDVIRIKDDYAIVQGLPDGVKLLKDPFTGAFPGFRVKVANGSSEKTENKVTEAISSGQ